METVVQSSGQTTDELYPRQHGAHLPCQREAPFVTLVCGLVAGWDERNDEDGLMACALCWEHPVCPICGARLAAT